jgi:hypothetical protein
MVDVQDGDAHTHKRTAIPQLLNPVSSSPTKRQEEHGLNTYRGTFQSPSASPSFRSNLARPDLSPTGPQTFHLRAADWGRGDSSPPSTVHYASSPDTNGSVRSCSASYPTYDSGPRPNDGNGYIMTTSYPTHTALVYHPQSVGNSPSPAPHSMPQTPLLFYHDGRMGKHSENFELSHSDQCHPRKPSDSESTRITTPQHRSSNPERRFRQRTLAKRAFPGPNHCRGTPPGQPGTRYACISTTTISTTHDPCAGLDATPASTAEATEQ